MSPRIGPGCRRSDLDMQVTPAIFTYKGRELMVTGSKECRVYLIDPKSAGGENHQTPLVRTPLLCNEEVNFASAGIWGSMASWEDAKGTRWVLTPFWGPVHPDFKAPVSYGPVKHGAVVAFKVEEKNGKLQLTPAWMSRDMDQAEPPVIANGVVFAYGSGENTVQSYPDRGLNDSSPLRIKASTHASLICAGRRNREGVVLERRSDCILRALHAACRWPTGACIWGPSTACCIASALQEDDDEKRSCSGRYVSCIRCGCECAGSSCKLAHLRRRRSTFRLGERPTQGSRKIP